MENYDLPFNPNESFGFNDYNPDDWNFLERETDPNLYDLIVRSNFTKDLRRRCPR